MQPLMRIEVLGAAAAAQVAERVNGLREHWIERDGFALHTLGAAAYLDAPTAPTLAAFGVSAPPENAYAERTERLNGLLRERFGALYDTLLDALATLLEAEVDYAQGKALPGFHIFGAHAGYAAATTHVPHFDRQYENLPWPEPVTVRDATTVSFTLPVRLPAAGGGLTVWDVSLRDVLDLERKQARARVKAAPSRRERYRHGELVCHPGHQLHRIAPWQAEADEQRITLQGHALCVGNRWQVYW